MANTDRISEITARCEAAKADLAAEYECGSYLSTRGYVTIKESLADVPHLLEQLAAAAAECERLREAQRWVPIGEKLPERYEAVLVYSLLWVRPVIAFIRDDDEFWTGRQAVAPTHWCPLPSPPEEPRV